MSSEYLFEARFFELPPQRVEKVLKRLTGRLFEDLMGRGLGPAEIVTGMTPRRLMVCLKGLPEVEPEREEQHLGPPLTEAYDGSGGPTDALRGFVGRLGVEMEALTEIKTERGAYLGVVRQVPGRSLAEALGDLVPTVLEELDWWRPLRLSGLSGVVSLLDGEVLPLTVLGTKAGRETTGHPVLSPAPIPVESFADYTEALRRLGLEVVFETRRQQLEEGLVSRASELGGELVADAELLARLTATCEVPGIVHGAFERDHLSLPEEVLLAALSGHSNACAVRGESGLLADFLTVMDRADDPQGKIRRGQERAVAGRLIDARFRYDRDRRIALAERRRLLEALDLHPRLGSYAAKADRIRALVALACSQLGWDDVLEPAREAAALLKADLTCGLVRDFPSLRGTVGGIYAREEGYVEAVWLGIYEHYQSRPIPQRRTGQVLAIADRLDSLVGFFGIGQVPSGSRDPFGLRRLAQGLLRIVTEAGLELDLDLLAARAVLLYGDLLDRGAETLLGELQTFLSERFRHLMGQRGFAFDEIEAAQAVSVRNLPDRVARLEALRTVREEPEFRSLVLAAKRIFNISQDSREFEVRPEELAEGAEQDLHEALSEVREVVDLAVSEGRYEDGLRAMAELVPHLDRFFADVLVMDENERLKANRIALLQACRRVFWRIARLKEMVVEKGSEATEG